MEKEYRFYVQECGGCGLKLSGIPVGVGGWKGSQPMGYCPQCGIAYPLVEIESEPKPEPEAEPELTPHEAEPEPEPPAE